MGSRVFQFERHELDVGRYELRRAGRVMRLPRLPMELLILLVDRRGSLVTRDEIVAHLWQSPETIETGQSINTAINRIRAVLNDDPARPRFVETVVGKGYRFIGNVEELPPVVVEGREPARTVVPASEIPAPERREVSVVVRPPRRLFWHSRWLPGVTFVAGVAVGLTIWPARNAFSPPEVSFRAITTNSSDSRITAAAISSDGRILAYSDNDGLFLRAIRTGEIQQIRAPERFRVDRIVWFPDGLRLLAGGFDTFSHVPTVWIVSTAGAAPRLLREGARQAVPSPDGNRVAFIRGDAPEVWIVEASGERAQRVVAGSAPDEFSGLLWSPNGKRLSYVCRRPAAATEPDPDPAVQDRKKGVESSYSFPSVEVATGQVLSKNDGTRMDLVCSVSDGRVLFARPASDNATSFDIWESRTDSRSGALIGVPKRVYRVPRFLSAISAAADGRQIVAVVVMRMFNADVHTAEIAAGSILTAQHRLTLDVTADYPRAWTPDGKSVIFESSRNGNWDLYRQRIGQGAPEQLVVTPFNEALAQVTPDGRWLLYASWAPGASPSTRALKRIPLEGGNSQDVPVSGPLDEFRCASPGGKRCVLRTREEHLQYGFHELDPVAGKGRELARTAWSPAEPQDWGLSPDGSTVAIPIHEIHQATLRLVSLDRPRERDVVLAGLGSGYGELREVYWDVNDKGWFVSLRTPVGVELLHVGPDGQTQVMFESSFETWGIPSPGGRQMAFIDRRCNSNAWLLQRGN